MKNKYFLVFFVIMLIALSLAACERSASTPPPDNATGFPTLEGSTQDPIDELNQFSTQTAIAAEAGDNSGETEDGNETEGEQPPEEPQATEVPEEQPAATPVPEKDYPVPKKYTLKKGEFPYCIARRFDISPGALLAANGLGSSSVTYTGQTLTIPQDAGSFDAGSRPLRAHPTDYIVQAGDTVNSIACLFGDVYPEAIEDHNGLSGAYTISVGQTLKIP